MYCTYPKHDDTKLEAFFVLELCWFVEFLPRQEPIIIKFYLFFFFFVLCRLFRTFFFFFFGYLHESTGLLFFKERKENWNAFVRKTYFSSVVVFFLLLLFFCLILYVILLLLFWKQKDLSTVCVYRCLNNVTIIRFFFSLLLLFAKGMPFEPWKAWLLKCLSVFSVSGFFPNSF